MFLKPYPSMLSSASDLFLFHMMIPSTKGIVYPHSLTGEPSRGTSSRRCSARCISSKHIANGLHVFISFPFEAILCSSVENTLSWDSIIATQHGPSHLNASFGSFSSCVTPTKTNSPPRKPHSVSHFYIIALARLLTSATYWLLGTDPYPLLHWRCGTSPLCSPSKDW